MVVPGDCAALALAKLLGVPVMLTHGISVLSKTYKETASNRLKLRLCWRLLPALKEDQDGDTCTSSSEDVDRLSPHCVGTNYPYVDVNR